MGNNCPSGFSCEEGEKKVCFKNIDGTKTGLCLNEENQELFQDDGTILLPEAVVCPEAVTTSSYTGVYMNTSVNKFIIALIILILIHLGLKYIQKN